MGAEDSALGLVNAVDASAESTNPLEDETDGSYVLHRVPGLDPAAGAGLKRLQDQLDARDRPALVHDLRDVQLQTTHWMVSIRGDLIRDTRYLIHEQYLARNFQMIKRSEAIALDHRRIWILGANYAPGNYWHWHAQSLPAILHALETIPAHEFDRVSVLTGELTGWQREGLGALGLRSDQIVEMERGRTVQLDRLIYSDLLSSRQVFGQNRARAKTAEMLRKAAEVVSIPALGKQSRRLYISRRDSARRPVLNEAELAGALERLGFTSVANSDMGLFEQVRLFEAADVVVAAHGAGSTNMLFMQPGTAFVELQQASHVNAGPLSLGKTSRLVPYADVFEDDGRGQATEGWTVDLKRAISLVETASEQQQASAHPSR